jgi:hypothetical protein
MAASSLKMVNHGDLTKQCKVQGRVKLRRVWLVQNHVGLSGLS